MAVRTGNTQKSPKKRSLPIDRMSVLHRESENHFRDDHRQFTISPSTPYSQDVASLRDQMQLDEPEFNTSAMQWMLPFNRMKMQRELAAVHLGRYHWRTNESDYAEYQRLLKLTLDDAKISKDINSYRQFEITSDILSLPFALGAFQAINLSADELPMMVTPQARQYFAVRWIGQDGGARQDQWRTSRAAESIEMKMLSTDKVEYSLYDLQEGFLNEVENINAQLRFDMEMKIENLALSALNAGVYASGLKALMNIHPDVDPANLPDENYLDLTNTGTYGPDGIFTIARLKAILHQIAKWGFGFSPDGNARLKTMIMSPQNARDSWDFVDLVSGWDTSGKSWPVKGEQLDSPRATVPTATREEIFRSGGMINNAWGYTWETQFNPRVPKGRLYVLTDQPIGWFFTKTDFDRLIEWKDGPDNIEQNQGQIMLRRALNFFQPALWAYRYLVVDFKAP